MTKKQKVQETNQTQADRSAIDLLKDKLRKKYHLLKEDRLEYDDRDELLDHVCEILGMYRNELDVVLQDL